MAEDKKEVMEEVKATTPSTDAPEAVVSKKSKKNKRVVSHGQLHIYSTFNNTIITVTDANGGVLTASSAGANGFRGSKKGTAYASQIAGEKAIEKARANYGLTSLDVFVKGIGLGRDAAIRAALSFGIIINSITDQTAVAHGGVRRKGERKV
ncbi:MAG: 30S ribosomal protein S11 [Candidatus Nomurabacteria bacterium]|nr:30S ribosomal protein S11 [Candidatus Nomurabacteria bacterium]